MFEAWQPNLARRFGVAAPLRGTGWQHGSRSASHFGQQWLGLQMMAQSVAGERDISLGGATLGRICAPSWQQIWELSASVSGFFSPIVLSILLSTEADMAYY